jgi:hypothetical protein
VANHQIKNRTFKNYRRTSHPVKICLPQICADLIADIKTADHPPLRIPR